MKGSSVGYPLPPSVVFRTQSKVTSYRTQPGVLLIEVLAEIAEISVNPLRSVAAVYPQSFVEFFAIDVAEYR